MYKDLKCYEEKIDQTGFQLMLAKPQKQHSLVDWTLWQNGTYHIPTTD